MNVQFGMQSAAVNKDYDKLCYFIQTPLQSRFKKIIDNFSFEKESLSIANKSVTFIISEITTTE